MNEALENLLTRRSCRSYESRQVEAEKLNEVLTAGTYAPTGMGTQSPYIVAVQTPETLDAVERLNAEAMGRPGTHPFYGAPTVIIVFGNSESPLGASDANLVLGNLLNAANAVGLDSCYIWRAKETFSTEEGKRLKKEWGIPDGYEGAGNVILGYGRQEGRRQPAPRKEGYFRIV